MIYTFNHDNAGLIAANQQHNIKRSSLARFHDGKIHIFQPASEAMYHETTQVNYDAVRAGQKALGIMSSKPLDRRQARH